MQISKGSVVSQPSVLVLANHVASFAPLPNMNLAKARNFRSIFFGSYGRLKSITRTCELFVQPCEKKTWAVCCIFSSSSDGNGSLAGNFDENDEEFVNSTVIEAGKFANFLLLPYLQIVTLGSAGKYQCAYRFINEIECLSLFLGPDNVR